MSCSYTFFTTSARLPMIQQIVRDYDMRFDNNPAKYLDLDSIMVVVSGDGSLFSQGVQAISAYVSAKDQSEKEINEKAPKSFWNACWKPFKQIFSFI